MEVPLGPRGPGAVRGAPVQSAHEGLHGAAQRRTGKGSSLLCPSAQSCVACAWVRPAFVQGSSLPEFLASFRLLDPVMHRCWILSDRSSNDYHPLPHLGVCANAALRAAVHGVLQVHMAENAFLIHHANAFEEGDETVVLSSGWVRPTNYQAFKLASMPGILVGRPDKHARNIGACDGSCCRVRQACT